MGQIGLEGEKLICFYVLKSLFYRISVILALYEVTKVISMSCFGNQS